MRSVGKVKMWKVAQVQIKADKKADKKCKWLGNCVEKMVLMHKETIKKINFRLFLT